MAEFRVAAGAGKFTGVSIRLALWTSAVALTGVMLFALYGSPDQIESLRVPLACLAVIIVLGAVVLAHVFSFRRGLDKVKRDLLLEMTEDGLVSKRPGWPDVRIGFAEITALSERPGWLIVKAPQRTIMIPDQVERFSSLRAQLGRHAVITAAPKRSPLVFVPLLATILAWGLVLFSNTTYVILAAAAMGLSLFAWSSIRTLKSLSRSPKQAPAVWLWLGLGWLLVVWVVVNRITNHR